MRGVYLLLIGIPLLDAHVLTIEKKPTRSSRPFPDDFEFGAATAAYQIEGGWNDDGKGWSMWDHLIRTNPDHIADNTTGDVAANSYHLYKRDVEMLVELGVHNYRFSISWPRILPYGRPNYVNPAGVTYYNALIDELVANKITPFITLYHWDLPQNLNEQGGLLNDEFSDWFGDYARVIFSNFGDRVKHWMTVNEPFVHCNQGFATGNHPPRIQSPGINFYQCGRNMLLGSARAYHIYDDEFRSTQNGEIGIVLSSDWAMPATNSANDTDAVDSFLAFKFGQYIDPIFSESGNYPQLFIDQVAIASANQGYNTSRLPPFTQEEVEYLRGSSDFLALNHYTSVMVYRNESVAGMYGSPSFYDDAFFGYYRDSSWPTSASSWLVEYAPGFYNLLVYIKERYNSPKIYVTENGFSTTTGLNDSGRVQYYRNYLSALQDALDAGVDIRGYFAWSLMDNFEWAAGYSQRFGLFEVDMSDENRRRTPRKSALVYKDIVTKKIIDFEYDPDPYRNDASGVKSPVFAVAAAAAAILMIITCNYLSN